MHKLTDEQKLNYFESLLRDDTIDFWQTLKITTETTLTEILQAFSKEYAKEDLKEVSKYKFDQMRYDPTTESFADFLTKFKKLAKQAYGDKANDIVETFLFAKLPIQIQNDLAMAGKHDATSEEIKTFVQRRCQYAQLLPTPAGMQPLNNIQNYPAKQQTNQQTATTSTPGKPTANMGSNENSKATVDTATLLDTSGLTAENASETKQTESTQKLTNAPNRTTTTSSLRLTNPATTRS